MSPNTNSKAGPKPRAAIEAMDPYRPPSSGREDKLRLDFNENTVGCSPRVVKRLGKVAAQDLTVYPAYEEVFEQLAGYFGVRADQMALTNGTDEAIQLVVNTYVGEKDRVIVLRPSYAMYRFYAQVAGARVIEIDYAADLRFPHEALLRAARSGAKAIFIANPNNPTGTLASPEELREILEAAPNAAVLIDEAYFEFCGRTVLPWINRFPNLFVSRTFSKAFGLAALRVGCLFSDAANIAVIRKGQSPYSVNALGVACALEAIRDPGYVKKYAAEVIRARVMLCQELQCLGWKYFPSAANFVLVQFGSASGAVLRMLRDAGILVRDRGYEVPGCVRITVGTIAQTRRLISALRSISRADVDGRVSQTVTPTPKVLPKRVKAGALR
ncbi:MAG: histidinol-phosphate transaminase [Acidobacteria bacterium]|nr:histidinol-phosphate transaminase [Acidobacteriota bacterium]